MKNIIKGFIALFFLSISSSSIATILDIDFNGNQFLLETFESAETGSDFYRYGNPSGSSANPVYPGTTDLIPLFSDAAHIYTHINTLNNKLSFGIILEKPNGSGGGLFSADLDWAGPAVLSFVDDPGESGTINAAGPQSISLKWVDCCTDGFVISGFDPNDLFIDLTNVLGSDLTEVIFLSPDRNNTNFSFPQDEFNISIANCVPATDPNACVIITTPEPSIVFLFVLSCFGLYSSRRLLDVKEGRNLKLSQVVNIRKKSH